MSRVLRRGFAMAVIAASHAVLVLAAQPAGGAQDTAAMQRGEQIRGEQIYARCAACHAIEGNRTGPQHCGLFGRRAGTAPGFDGYSQALRESQIVWNERTLDIFLQDPARAVPGTTMGYAGVKDPRERTDLIGWLRQASAAGTTCTPAR